MTITRPRNKGAKAIALTIAGSDSGGGAGIQADLKAFSALGVYGCSVITALTAQNTCAVTALHDIPPEMVAAQLAAVLDDIDVCTIKVGMLSSTTIIETVAAALKPLSLPIVLDPVMVAKSGDRLLQDNAVSALKELLLPLATVLTPNLPEAADLLRVAPARTEADMLSQAEELLTLGSDHVLMKGGHGNGETCVDLLVSHHSPPLRFTAPRLATKNTHGTGCTLSASIAAGLAKGLCVQDAAREAHAYLKEAIASADTLHIGQGHGPVHHFHNMWR